MPSATLILSRSPRPVWEVYEEERASLQALPPRAFDGYRRETLRTSPTSLIRFDRKPLQRRGPSGRPGGGVEELRRPGAGVLRR